jgi:hypothetical protein
MKKLITLSMVFLFLLGCESTTLIKSNPSGAKLQVDGQRVGETPHFYTDKAAAGTVKTVTLKKEGYKDFNGSIKREKLSVPALIGGIFLIVPFVWIMEYSSQYNFEMEKLQKKQTQQVDPSSRQRSKSLILVGKCSTNPAL